MIYITNRRNQNDFLIHHGILGQKWGRRNGPPYPLSGGDYSTEEKKHIDKDYTITIKKTMQTMSRNPNRLDSDMVYVAYKSLDKHWYNAFLNQKAPEPIYDENGNNIGTGNFLKYNIKMKSNEDLKIAGEESSIESFSSLYKNNRDFYNYVMDPNRMEKAFRDTREGKRIFAGYREALESLAEMRNKKVASYDDVSKAYRLFNYVIPYETSNKRLSSDVKIQRAKFFKELKNNGYSGLYDINDAKYNHLGIDSPTIIFDMEKVVPPVSIKRSTTASKAYSTMVSIGKKACGL